MRTSIIPFLVALLAIPMIGRTQYDPADAPGGKWQASRWGFGLGADDDHYTSMSLTDLMAFAKEPEAMQRDLSLFEAENTTVTRGLALYGHIAFAPRNRTTGKYSTRQEIQLGVALRSPKEAMVTYKNKDLDTSIVYCNLHGEFALEAAYLFKGQWGKRFPWYIGAGAGGGVTFANEMVLISGRYLEPGEHPSMMESTEMSEERFDARSVRYVRAYVPFGIHYRIGSRWSVGFDMRRGLGWQFIQGEETNFIARTGSFIIGAKVLL